MLITEAGESEVNPRVKLKSKPQKRKQSTKTSNRFSTEKKAMLHLATLTGVVTIGAALAPFTLGLSLLPTVFVVAYGNAAMLSVYGQSRFVVGDQDKKKDPLEPAKSLDKEELPTRPHFQIPLAELPHPKDEVDDDKEAGRGDTFNNSWYVFINAPSGQVGNVEPQGEANLPSEPNDNHMGTQSAQESSIDSATQAFADAAKVTVIEIPIHERQERLKLLISGYGESADPRLTSLFNLLIEDEATCAQMVEITGKDGATAYAIIPQGEQTPNTVEMLTAKTVTTQGYTGRKWEVNIPTPVSLTQGAQTGSNFTQGPRRNLGTAADAAPSVADVGNNGDQIDVPAAIAGMTASVGTPDRPSVAGQTTNTHQTATTPQADDISTDDMPATVAEANAAQGYTGRKWEVNIPTPVSLTQGAQTGSNFTQGPRRNLGTVADAAPSVADVGNDGDQIDVPAAIAGTTASVGTPDRPSVTGQTTNTHQTATTPQVDDISTDDMPATVAEANAAQGYTGRKWEVNIPTPVSLTQGAQTGSNFTQGPRRNLGTVADAAPSVADVGNDGDQIDVPAAIAGMTASVGTPDRPSVTGQTTNTHQTATMPQVDDISTDDMPATVAEANAAQSYTGRKWEVNIPTPVSLTQGAQTGSNFTQGPRRNLGTVADAAPSVADVGNDGDQIDVPAAIAGTTASVGTPDRPSVTGQTTNTHQTATTPQVDDISTDDMPATVAEANAAQSYTGRKWEVNIPTPVSLTQGAQTGSNFTQGPRRNLGTVADAAPSVADVGNDGDQIDVPAAIAGMTASVGTPDRPSVTGQTTNTHQTATMPQVDDISTDDMPATVAEANAAQSYTGRKWEVNIPTPVSLTQGAQTGSNFTQGPRRNLGTVADAAPSVADVGNDGDQIDVPAAIAGTTASVGTPDRPSVTGQTTNTHQTATTPQVDDISTDDMPATVAEANAAQSYTGRKWEVNIPTPVSLTQGAQTGSNFTQGPRRNLGTVADAAPSVADVGNDGDQIDVPAAIAGMTASVGTPDRPSVTGQTTNTHQTATMPQVDDISTDDMPATVAEANAAQSYTGRKWEVNIPTPVSLTQGAQTGSNFTQGPRRNLGTVADAAPSVADVGNDGDQIDVPAAIAGTTASVGTPDRPSVTGQTTNTHQTATTPQVDDISTDDMPATVAEANAAQSYTGRKWEVNIPTPVSLTQGAQTGSNFTQGPRRNLGTVADAAPSVADVGNDGDQIDVPAAIAGMTASVGTPDRPSVTGQTTNTHQTATMPQVDDISTDDMPATVAEANAAQSYTGRKWEVNIPTPVSLTQGAQTGSNFTQGPRRNLGTVADAAPSVADVGNDGDQIDVPAAIAGTTASVGTPDRPSVTGQTTNTHQTATTPQVDDISTDDMPATVAEANAAQSYTGRKWEVNIPTPVSLTQGAQTGSNFTQGPRRNLGTVADAAPSVADVGNDGDQIDVPAAIAGMTASVGTPDRPSVTGQTTNTHQTATMPQVDDISTDDMPATVAEANAAQSYTGRKWEVNIPTPVSLTQGAQTGSNFTQGPRRNLGTVADAAPSVADVGNDGDQIDVPAAIAGTTASVGTPDRPSVTGQTTNTHQTATTPQVDDISTDDMPATVAEANAAQSYTGRKWEVNIPTPVSLTQGAQTGSNFTQGPRRNLSSDLVSDLGSQRVPTAVYKDSDIIGTQVLSNVERSEAEIRLVRKPIQINKAAVEAVPVDTVLKPNFTTELQESAAKSSLNLDKIESRIVGRAGGHIQYKVPEAGIFMGSWRPIPEYLRGKEDSTEFAVWRKSDIELYKKSLNTKVLLTQGSVSMRGQNYFAGKWNNVKERTEIESSLKPFKRMNRADNLQISGLDFVSRDRSHLLATASGKLLVTPSVILSNLVSAA
ncbi:hypothetical protein [Shewanella sp. WE21]|uniref:hypothetical protein n=1 Tax=Shewanella sp. WE21 TaxID=2029986 RepID=UPI00131A45E8|nr:hypothetical protein [Shewanella sp. WE21]